MTDSNERPSEAIALITTPGLVEALIELHNRGGSASLAQLRAAGVPDPLQSLRTLAASGHLAGPGSFDQPFTEAAMFALTYSGRGLAGSVRELVDLGRTRVPPAPPKGFRPRAWLRLPRLGLTRTGQPPEPAAP